MAALGPIRVQTVRILPFPQLRMGTAHVPTEQTWFCSRLNAAHVHLCTLGKLAPFPRLHDGASCYWTACSDD